MNHQNNKRVRSAYQSMLDDERNERANLMRDRQKADNNLERRTNETAFSVPVT